MQNYRIICAAAVAAALLAGASPAQAREPGVIVGTVLKNYTSITKARKVLRSRLKKGQALTGDEYFALAYACGYEEPAGPSKIMNALAKSKCKDQIAEYYLQAGVHGTPHGFLAAARKIGAGPAAWLYAQLAYKLSGTDVDLRNDALGYLADLRPSIGNAAQQYDAQAETQAQKLVAAGVYSSSIPSAGGKQFANVLPNLNWLDFTNPKRCRWSQASQKIMGDSFGYDAKKEHPVVPAKVRVPGINRWITSRIARPKNMDGVVEVYTDFKGRWHGLTVLGLKSGTMEESDGYQETSIRFAEPVAVVARKLASMGFVVNANGSAREQVDKKDGYGNIDGVITSITRVRAETVFSCDEVTYASYGEG